VIRRRRRAWAVEDDAAEPSGAGPSPSDITWEEPASFEDALAHPGAGVMVIERGSGEDWQPANVAFAPHGFGARLEGFKEDLAGLGQEPDWSEYRVRLGTFPARRGNRADRALLRAVARDIAAKLGASSAVQPQDSRFLSAHPSNHGGAVPDYVAAGAPAEEGT
jgi:hypothetical protein